MKKKEEKKVRFESWTRENSFEFKRERERKVRGWNWQHMERVGRESHTFS